MIGERVTWTLPQPLSSSRATGQIIAISGPEASGKTKLLLEIFARLSNDVPVNLTRSLTVHQTRSPRSWVEYLPPDARAYSFLAVRDAVALYGAASTHSPVAVDDALERLELSHLRDVRIGLLSAVLRRRVLIAAAVHRGVPVLLLDDVDLIAAGARRLTRLADSALARVLPSLVRETCTVVIATARDARVLRGMAARRLTLARARCHADDSGELRERASSGRAATVDRSPAPV